MKRKLALRLLLEITLRDWRFDFVIINSTVAVGKLFVEWLSDKFE